MNTGRFYDILTHINLSFDNLTCDVTLKYCKTQQKKIEFNRSFTYSNILKYSKYLILKCIKLFLDKYFQINKSSKTFLIILLVPLTP